MSEVLLISVSHFETRVALLASGLLQEIHLARADGYSLTGNIYLGRVQRVIPGMQAAFVDVGLERPGFLHVRDIERPRLMVGEEPTRAPDIRDLLHDGQRLMVQIAKDPIAGKGARLTTQVAIASRYMVLMPFTDHIGISQRVEDEVERDRLKNLVAQIRDEQGVGVGFIARTAAEGAAESALANDIRLLTRIWDKVLGKNSHAGCPGIVYQELPLHMRVVRDLSGPAVERIHIDHKATYDRVREFVDEFIPEFSDRVVYDVVDEKGAEPMFKRFGVDEEISRALEKRVGLRNGGHLVIEQTEAMTTIDVNTGRFLGGYSLEETVYRTNLEAAQVIPRQLRLRNLGGIIVIDFIDMVAQEHQRDVLRVLEKACHADPAKTRIEGFSSLGLVQMSRKRTRESLVQQVCEPCGQCAGLGVVKSPESTCIEVFRALLEDARVRPAAAGSFLIRTTAEVVDRLLDEDALQLQHLSSAISYEIGFQVEPSYGPGEFDIVLVQDVVPAR